MTPRPSDLELLTDAKRGQVLHQLLDTHPEVGDDAECLANGVLSRIDRNTVAVQVQDALESVSTGDVAAISGKQRGGYLDPLEAIGILLEESIEPFLQRLRALAEAGHHDIATEIGNGILHGLEAAEGDTECAIYFDDQFAEMHAAHVIDEMGCAGLPLDVA